MRSVSLQQDWILHADLDEHHEFPWPVAVGDFFADCDRNGINVISGVFRDRVAMFVGFVEL